MFSRYTNFYFLRHLNNYDLLNKYCYTNFYLIPQHTKISLKIFLKGFFNFKLFRKYVSNFLLLYFFCFNFPHTKLKLTKLKNRKLRIYRVKLLLNYSFMKKKILLSIYNFYFLFNKFARPFFFSNQNFIFSKFGGKLYYYNVKIITFLPTFMLVDSIEQRYLNFLKKSKIFLRFTLKNILTSYYYNFFIDPSVINKNFLKNILLFWCFI